MLQCLFLLFVRRYIGTSIGTVNTKVQTSDSDEKDDSLSEPVAELSPLQIKLRRMSEGLCEVLDDYGLASFLPMNIQDGEVSGRKFNLTIL